MEFNVDYNRYVKEVFIMYYYGGGYSGGYNNSCGCGYGNGGYAYPSYGYGYGGSGYGPAIILVLFILLVIVLFRILSDVLFNTSWNFASDFAMEGGSWQRNVKVIEDED